VPFATAPDGARLYYETEGSGELLLLVMGPGSDHHGWDPLRAEFAARWQVIIFD
jgi:3-oxoadipate enol-lactonase